MLYWLGVKINKYHDKISKRLATCRGAYLRGQIYEHLRDRHYNDSWKSRSRMMLRGVFFLFHGGINYKTSRFALADAQLHYPSTRKLQVLYRYKNYSYKIALKLLK